jgi:hypothetical protein
MALEIGTGELAARSTYLLGLSSEDIAARRTCLGGSDANIIIGADPDRVLALWRFKTGLEEPEDLSDNLAVQMGTWTEGLNLHWYAKMTGRTVGGKGRRVTHPKYGHLRVTLDGETEIEGVPCVIDAKHTSPFNFDMETLIARYQPQLALSMECLGYQKAQLSVFAGNSKWEASRVIERDPFYAAAIIAKLNEFWSHVQSKTPPVEIEPVEPPTPVALMRKVDLSTSNMWVAHEEEYLATEDHAKRHDDAAKTMRSMVDPDVCEARGRSLMAKRDKRGALRFSKIANGYRVNGDRK